MANVIGWRVGRFLFDYAHDVFSRKRAEFSAINGITKIITNNIYKSMTQIKFRNWIGKGWFSFNPNLVQTHGLISNF